MCPELVEVRTVRFDKLRAHFGRLRAHWLPFADGRDRVRLKVGSRLLLHPRRHHGSFDRQLAPARR